VRGAGLLIWQRDERVHTCGAMCGDRTMLNPALSMRLICPHAKRWQQSAFTFAASLGQRAARRWVP
jgi:hypothetical protein